MPLITWIILNLGGVRRGTAVLASACTLTASAEVSHIASATLVDSVIFNPNSDVFHPDSAFLESNVTLYANGVVREDINATLVDTSTLTANQHIIRSTIGDLTDNSSVASIAEVTRTTFADLQSESSVLGSASVLRASGKTVLISIPSVLANDTMTVGASASLYDVTTILANGRINKTFVGSGKILFTGSATSVFTQTFYFYDKESWNSTPVAPIPSLSDIVALPDGSPGIFPDTQITTSGRKSGKASEMLKFLTSVMPIEDGDGGVFADSIATTSRIPKSMPSFPASQPDGVPGTFEVQKTASNARKTSSSLDNLKKLLAVTAAPDGNSGVYSVTSSVIAKKPSVMPELSAINPQPDGNSGIDLEYKKVTGSPPSDALDMLEQLEEIPVENREL